MKTRFHFLSFLLVLGCGGLAVSEHILSVQAGGKEATISTEAIQASSPEPMIRFSRRMCFGSCPVYEVRIFKNGVVEYQGEYFVLKTGYARKEISQETINELQDAFETSGFFQLPPGWGDDPVNCYMMTTDLPSVVVEYRDDRRTKKINHNAGVFCTPGTFSDFDLAAKIDDLVGTIEWVGTQEERQHI